MIVIGNTVYQLQKKPVAGGVPANAITDPSGGAAITDPSGGYIVEP